jgi:beta-mannosidase
LLAGRFVGQRRRFYDDVLVSPYAHDGQVDVYVVSDKLQPLSGRIRARLLDFAGNTLFEKSQAAQIPPSSSAIYLTLDEKDLFGDSSKTDRHRDLLVVDLEIGGKAVSRNTVYFDITHNLELPVAPKIESTLAKSGNGYTLTLKSPLLARSVYISFGDLDVQTSDNYFDLLPNEAVSIILKTSATLNQTQSALKIVSLTEAFASPGTHY